MNKPRLCEVNKPRFCEVDKARFCEVSKARFCEVNKARAHGRAGDLAKRLHLRASTGGTHMQGLHLRVGPMPLERPGTPFDEANPARRSQPRSTKPTPLDEASPARRNGCHWRKWMPLEELTEMKPPIPANNGVAKIEGVGVASGVRSESQ